MMLRHIGRDDDADADDDADDLRQSAIRERTLQLPRDPFSMERKTVISGIIRHLVRTTRHPSIKSFPVPLSLVH